jgi:5'-nucleotidase
MQISHARSGARILGLALTALAVAVPAAQAAPKEKAKNEHVQLLAINDLHGHLQPNTPGTIQVGCCNPVLTDGVQTGWGAKTVPAGGVSFLATHIKQLRAQNKNTFTVGAGDMIGASPLISALFHDEPTIEALNSIGFDDIGVGNHEFDEGIAELQRMQYGDQKGGDGCHPTDGCLDGSPFDGAFFKYLAANVFFENSGKTIFPPYEIQKVDGAKIAFIGLTFEGTPTVVTPSGVAGLRFAPEVSTTNALVRKLKREQNVKSFVVLLHQGGTQVPPAPVFPGPADQPDAYMDVNKCVNFQGPEIQDIAAGLDKRVSTIISAHTHQPYICNFSGKLVTSAASFGRVVTSVDLTLDTKSGKVVGKSARNQIVTQNVAKDPAAEAIVQKYDKLSAPLANKVIGTITGDLLSARGTPNGQNAAGEQPMGDVIADGQLAATKATDFGGAVAAFMNAGGVRSSLFYAKSGTETVDGQVTYGEAFNVQPFGNTLVVKTCTGQQIYDVLNQQFNNPSAGSNRIMLPSANVRYTWDNATKKVVDGTVSFDSGTSFIDKNASYRVTMNNFMADGGDGYTVFRSCTNPLGGEVDLDAFARYLQANPNLAPPALNRITRIN